MPFTPSLPPPRSLHTTPSLYLPLPPHPRAHIFTIIGCPPTPPPHHINSYALHKATKLISISMGLIHTKSLTTHIPLTLGPTHKQSPTTHVPPTCFPECVSPTLQKFLLRVGPTHLRSPTTHGPRSPHVFRRTCVPGIFDEPMPPEGWAALHMIVPMHLLQHKLMYKLI